MNSVPRLDIRAFLERSSQIPVADVRSPKEFEHGHIPGAYNLPLFHNEERALVGTVYNMSGKEKAVETGMEIAGRRLGDYVKMAKEISVDDRVLVHCWRGGMRSESLAWLMQTAGMKIAILEGGYKSFRRFVLDELEKDRRMILIGGMTGSGKTEILLELGRMGYPVADLEGISKHKGSVFGGMGQGEQPTQEQFENDLGEILRTSDAAKPVFIEDESVHIGKIGIPKPFYTRMKQAPMILIEVDRTARAERIFNEYACFDRDFLVSITGQLTRRMGGDRTQSAMNMIRQGQILEAIILMLEYYDKTYSHALSKRDPALIHRISLSGHDTRHHAIQISTYLKTIGVML